MRRTGAKKVTDPRGLQIDWAKSDADQLSRLLADARPAVRKRAIGTLAARGKSVLDTVFRYPVSLDRAVGVACRIDAPEAREKTRMVLYVGTAHDDTLHQTAIHAIGLWRDRESRPPPIAVQPLTQLAGALSVATLQSARVAGGAPPTVTPIPPQQIGQITAGLQPSGFKPVSGQEDIKTYALQGAVALSSALTDGPEAMRI